VPGEGTDVEAQGEAITHYAEGLRRQGRMFEALRLVRRTMWRRRAPVFRTPRTGRAPLAGAWLIESRCTAPERAGEFEHWYDEVHIPDLLATGLFHTASRYVAASGEARGGGEARYLAMYETGRAITEAVNAFAREHRPRLRAAGRLSELIEVTWPGAFQRLR